MKTTKRDFIFDATLVQYNDSLALLRASDIYDVYKGMSPEDKKTINSTDLYFICKKPRLRVVANSLILKNNSLHIGFELSLKEGSKQQFLVINNYPLSEPTFMVNQFNSYKISHNQGVGTFPIEWLINYLIDGMHCQDPSLYFKEFEYKYVNHYEVLYVGQSFIKKGRGAFNRILNHEKLQQILANTLSYEPYNEVFIMFIEMSKEAKGVFVSKAGYDSKNIGCKQLKELTHRINIPKEQLLNIAEASFIRYFEPEYNKNFKYSFPSSDLKLLKECYDYDFSTIATEIGTEYIRCNMYSQKVFPSERHIVKFNLNNDKKA